MSIFPRDPKREKLEEKIFKIAEKVFKLTCQIQAVSSAEGGTIFRGITGLSQAELRLAESLTKERDRLVQIWDDIELEPLTLVRVQSGNPLTINTAVVLSDQGETIEVFLIRQKQVKTMTREEVICGHSRQFPGISGKAEIDFEKYVTRRPRIEDYLGDAGRTRDRVEDILESIDHPLAGQFVMRSVL